MNGVLLGVMGYVLVQLGIGWYVSRRIRTEDDYLVAGRSLGYPLATFTIFATWFGAETCIGAAGRIYEHGLAGSSSDPFGYGMCLLLMGLFFAVPLWKRRLTTVGDFFRTRFSARIEKIAVLLMVPTSLLWAAAQIRAFGQVLAVASGYESTLMITVAAGVVILYTAFGGLLADAWTDLVQGIALIVGLGVLFVGVMVNGGVAQLAAVGPERLGLFGGSERSLLAVVEEWAIPVCGSLMAAELVSRVIATRSPQVARRSTLLAAGVYLGIGLIPATMGLIGFTLVPGLEDPEQILPVLAQQHLPTLLYTLFAGALVSAILSTVDTALLVSGSLVSHNVLLPLRPGLTEAQKVRLSRLAVAIFGVLAYLMALYADGVYTLVEQASAFGSAGIFVAMGIGLFTRFGGEKSAFVALRARVRGRGVLPFPRSALPVHHLGGRRLRGLCGHGGVRPSGRPPRLQRRRGTPGKEGVIPVFRQHSSIP
jgi:Na+/proline symporter